MQTSLSQPHPCLSQALASEPVNIPLLLKLDQDGILSFATKNPGWYKGSEDGAREMWSLVTW